MIGHSKRVTTTLFASERSALHLGQHVWVVGDAVPQREARVAQMDTGAPGRVTLDFIN